ncbi:alanyl-tRNA synthetase domain-containing protein [Verticillium alfalfae VaMs.102]|uniref:Alanyl-tRNA synthetase domain-containing protein n=1 Tax=Verticillium alfalfae (strain VaMs.102 / ATCC MYA-4576 / FGSC 10136) TaxID=526221 RepID=C9SRK4_VERA1|nr:alanyl-tRNA synthetase domain-containing protein [Verticillium alfalfae VaMs.102]EEY21419.1 alanyl-tRNA synthetase domain-containing protein [Verticillium alfalfae VaMs.102]
MTVPATASSGRVVGALACQQDSYLRTLESEVLSCVKRPPPTSQEGGKRKSKAAAESAEAKDPSDSGTLIPLDDEAAEPIPIDFVQRQGLQCIYHSPRPLAPGTRVRQTVDFDRRWDHMQQHTGQHLLSAVMDKCDNLETLGWGMGKPGEANYVDLPQKPSPEEIQAIQDRCNEIIRDSMPITVDVPQNAKDDTLPDDYDKTKGVVRVIHIGDVDSNTCWRHSSWPRRHTLLSWLLHSTQPVHVKHCRLFFTAGDRAIKLAANSIAALTSVGKVLSCGGTPDQVIASTTRLRDVGAELRSKEKRLLSELARFEGERARAAIAAGRDAWVYRIEDGLDYANLIVSEVKDAAIAAGAGRCHCDGRDEKSGPVVVEAVPAVKGGGKGEKWQGKVTEWQKGELERLRLLVEPESSN